MKQNPKAPFFFVSCLTKENSQNRVNDPVFYVAGDAAPHLPMTYVTILYLRFVRHSDSPESDFWPSLHAIHEIIIIIIIIIIIFIIIIIISQNATRPTSILLSHLLQIDSQDVESPYLHSTKGGGIIRLHNMFRDSDTLVYSVNRCTNCGVNDDAGIGRVFFHCDRGRRMLERFIKKNTKMATTAEAATAETRKAAIFFSGEEQSASTAA